MHIDNFPESGIERFDCPKIKEPSTMSKSVLGAIGR
jgi:hypothetical protein